MPSGTRTAFVFAAFRFVNPLSSGTLVEVAARNDERLLRLAEFYLYPEAFAYTYVVGHVTGEDEVYVERAVFDFGEPLS